MRTAALVAMDGSIDWLCLPRFDSPSVFGALLDHAQGGHFRISPVDQGFAENQHYWPSTNVLITRFRSANGAAEITDFMPMGDSKQRDACTIVRRVQAVRGSVAFHLECQPAFNYGRDSHRVGAEFRGRDLPLQVLKLGPLFSYSSPQGRQGSSRAIYAQRG